MDWRLVKVILSHAGTPERRSRAVSGHLYCQAGAPVGHKPRNWVTNGHGLIRSCFCLSEGKLLAGRVHLPCKLLLQQLRSAPGLEDWLRKTRTQLLLQILGRKSRSSKRNFQHRQSNTTISGSFWKEVLFKGGVISKRHPT